MLGNFSFDAWATADSLGHPDSKEAPNPYFASARKASFQRETAEFDEFHPAFLPLNESFHKNSFDEEHRIRTGSHFKMDEGLIVDYQNEVETRSSAGPMEEEAVKNPCSIRLKRKNNKIFISRTKTDHVLRRSGKIVKKLSKNIAKITTGDKKKPVPKPKVVKRASEAREPAEKAEWLIERLIIKINKTKTYWNGASPLIPNVFRLARSLEEEPNLLLEHQDLSSKELLVQGFAGRPRESKRNDEEERSGFESMEEESD